jgi:lipoprotein-anchoring transpeptidase ErfK/SrfK
VAGTPCSVSARACVDLDTQRAWLIDNGKVVRGPVMVSSGGAGKETPIGHSFRVYLKDKDHASQEFKLASGAPAPMPWSVFFADGGIAFHSGNPARASAGCIHLSPADAQAWFNFLQVGDQVQVVRASEEKAARTAH